MTVLAGEPEDRECQEQRSAPDRASGRGLRGRPQSWKIGNGSANGRRACQNWAACAIVRLPSVALGGHAEIRRTKAGWVALGTHLTTAAIRLIRGTTPANVSASLSMSQNWRLLKVTPFGFTVRTETACAGVRPSFSFARASWRSLLLVLYGQRLVLGVDDEDRHRLAGSLSLAFSLTV
jgi:hypothetical protein